MISKYYDEKNENKIIRNMLENNKIDGILEYKITINKIHFVNEGLTSFSQYLQGVVDQSEFIKLLTNLLNNLSNLELFMISESAISLERQEIYLDQDGKILLMVNPSLCNNKTIRDLYREIYLDTIFSTNTNDNILLRINNYFNSENYSVEGLLTFINNNIERNRVESKIPEVNFPEVNEKEKNIEKKEKNNKIFSIGLGKIFNKKEKKIIENKKI